MPRVFYPPEFKSKEEYIKHLEEEVDKLQKVIQHSEHNFIIIRRWSLGVLALLIILIILRIMFDSGIFPMILEVLSIIIFGVLLLFWMTVRNIMMFKYKSKISDFRHDVEDLEEVYNTLIKSKEGEEAMLSKQKIIDEKSGKLRALIKQDREHFKRFIVYFVYLLIGIIILILLKFVFGVI